MNIDELKKPIAPHPVKAIIDEMGLQRTRIARAAGISVNRLSSILNGHYKPTKKLNELFERIMKNYEELKNEASI